MKKELIVQGRHVSVEDIASITQLIDQNPSWNRTRLSKELCVQWEWRKENGQMKDMACRTFLSKLEKLGHIRLPVSQKVMPSISWNRNIEPVLHIKEPINELLKDLYPLDIQLIEKGYKYKEFKYFISKYHYLGWSGTVGENLKYMIYDKHGRALGCVMFGAAAWKVAPRDSYIGWSPEVRKSNLNYITNNNRFLILPWVRVDHLASHILGKICRRVNQDWINKYNHPVYLLETFVEIDRFAGTCYKAANWVCVGQTQGRGKLDIKNECALPVKSIWLYPLTQSYREKLKG
jgi:hypothetical protein